LRENSNADTPLTEEKTQITRTQSGFFTIPKLSVKKLEGGAEYEFFLSQGTAFGC
jgi:hypothetical protein